MPLSTPTKRNAKQEIRSIISNRCFDSMLQILREYLDDLDIWGDIDFEEALILFLVYLRTGGSFRKLEYRFNYSHSNYGNTFGKIIYFLNRYWSPSHIGDNRSGATRINITHQYTHNLDPAFGTGTFILDGHHIPLEKNEADPTWNIFHWSYKLHKPSFNVQVVLKHDEVIGFVSRPFPAARHDMCCMRNCYVELLEHLHLNSQEKIVADLGYQALQSRYNIPCLLPKKKPRTRQLSRGEQQWNRHIIHFRTKIERIFGMINRRFKIFHRPFRHHGRPHKVWEYLYFVSAIHNFELKIARESENQ
eukprot:gb/GECH01010254.1/.p1 GENE.gb/GECH01010254.1/~~gb/GECH01010254.1/.p1  ORF type:complete len:305 (+),score=-8.14 gb/GECH01010254.1/:1-915(+)